MNTLVKLQRALDARGASLTIHTLPRPDADGTVYVVWLYAPDDPAVFFCSEESDSLETAIEDAIREWDKSDEPEGLNEDDPPPGGAEPV